MVKLYRYNRKTDKWEFVDLGVRSKAELYAQMGFLVVYF